MRTFPCSCGTAVYFNNSRCLSCSLELGFVPEELSIASFDPSSGPFVLSKGPAAVGRRLKKCRNAADHGVCNWMLPENSKDEYCFSCRLTKVIPNLSVYGNKEYWRRLETEKRRLLYGLARLGLPVISKTEDSENGLGFSFLADRPDKNTYMETLGGEDRVLTGHSGGLITINVAEADDVSRELMRIRMDEPYRTLLGHFRHEIGHYYWDMLVKNAPCRADFDALFGNPLTDYGAALRRHYESPAKERTGQFISSYASAHPWEDWAETWAHWMHIVSTLETAHYHGLIGLDPKTPPIYSHVPTEELLKEWVRFAVAFNGVNISMGYHYLYPFVLTEKTSEKLNFVRKVIEGASLSRSSAAL